jgi:hypothetical protein
MPENHLKKENITPKLNIMNKTTTTATTTTKLLSKHEASPTITVNKPTIPKMNQTDNKKLTLNRPTSQILAKNKSVLTTTTTIRK